MRNIFLIRWRNLMLVVGAFLCSAFVVIVSFSGTYAFFEDSYWKAAFKFLPLFEGAAVDTAALFLSLSVAFWSARDVWKSYRDSILISSFVGSWFLPLFVSAPDLRSLFNLRYETMAFGFFGVQYVTAQFLCRWFWVSGGRDVD